MEALQLLHRYLDPYPGLFDIVYSHGRSIVNKVLEIMDLHPEIQADRKFIEEAALLHDIGVYKTFAPDIACFGPLPYICHGYLGADLLRDEGYGQHALVCERHTGAGISLQEIIDKQLPLPHRDMLPVSIEEQLICFADKFFSKTKLLKERSTEEARHKLERFGVETLDRFDFWCKSFL